MEWSDTTFALEAVLLITSSVIIDAISIVEIFVVILHVDIVALFDVLGLLVGSYQGTSSSSSNLSWSYS